jgi:predicted amidophosphoribosyltransferase
VGPHLDTSGGCSLCREERWAFDRVISLGVYEGSLRSAVLRIKRGGGEHLAAGLAEILWQKQRESLSRFQCDAIVPVPHHWWDRARRSHLPPITLARVLGARLGVRTINDVVAKVQRTPPQSQLPPSQRRLNLVRAFRDLGPLPQNIASVLIVDDVLTSGATAHRVAKALRDAGAARIHVAVIARGVG